MTTYTAITTGEIDIDSPLTQTLMTKMRDNPIAALEGDTSTPESLRHTQLLGTLTTTSGTTQTLSLLDLTNFRGLWIVLDGVSHGDVSNQDLQIIGGATADLSAGNAYAAAVPADGIVEIALDIGEGWGALGAATGTDAATNARWVRPQITNASTSVGFAWGGSAVFDAGTIYVYGRK